MWQQIVTEMGALSWIDWAATVTALLYVVLAARDNPWCWGWGIVSCSLWAYASFVFYELYLDALLQVFYVGIAFYGLYQWQRGGRGQTPLPISRTSGHVHASILGGGLVFTLLFGYFFDEYTQAAATYWDAATTVFSVLATFLLVQRKLENWIYWVLIDAVYCGLYYSRGAYLFTLLMAAYTVIALVAYFRWRNLLGEEKSTDLV